MAISLILVFISVAPVFGKGEKPSFMDREIVTFREIQQIFKSWQYFKNKDSRWPFESPVIGYTVHQSPEGKLKSRTYFFYLKPGSPMTASVHFLEGGALVSFYINSKKTYKKFYYLEEMKETGCGRCHNVPTALIPKPSKLRKMPEPEEKPNPELVPVPDSALSTRLSCFH